MLKTNNLTNLAQKTHDFVFYTSYIYFNSSCVLPPLGGDAFYTPYSCLSTSSFLYYIIYIYETSKISNISIYIVSGYGDFNLDSTRLNGSKTNYFGIILAITKIVSHLLIGGNYSEDSWLESGRPTDDGR